MKKLLVFLALSFAAFNVLAIELGDLGELNLNLTTAIAKVDMTGNTSATFAREGIFATTDLSASYMKAFEGYYVKSSMAMRYTDDPSLKGAEYFDFQRFNAELGSGFSKVIAGDHYAEMSRYTLGTQGRGLFGVYSAGQFSVKPFAARTLASRENAQYARYSTGLRADWTSEMLTAGINFVHSFDDKASLKTAPLSGKILRNTVYSASAALNLGRDLKIDGEFAGSKYIDESAGAVWLDSSAFFLKSAFKISDVRGTAEYERAGNDFTSVAGFVNTDRQTFRLNLQKMVDEKLRVYVNLERYNDNLADKKSATLVSVAPKIGCEYYEGKYAVNYSFRYIGRHDMASINNNNFVNSIDGFYTLDFMKTDLTFENSIYSDGKTKINSYTTNYVTANLKFPLKPAEDVAVNPGIGGSLNFEALNYLSGTDERFGVNTTGTLRFSLYVEVFKFLELGGLFSLSSVDKCNAEDSARSDASANVSVFFSEAKDMSVKAEYSALKYSPRSGVGSYGQETVKAAVSLAF